MTDLNPTPDSGDAIDPPSPDEPKPKALVYVAAAVVAVVLIGGAFIVIRSRASAAEADKIAAYCKVFDETHPQIVDQLAVAATSLKTAGNGDTGFTQSSLLVEKSQTALNEIKSIENKRRAAAPADLDRSWDAVINHPDGPQSTWPLSQAQAYEDGQKRINAYAVEHCGFAGDL